MSNRKKGMVRSLNPLWIRCHHPNPGINTMCEQVLRFDMNYEHLTLTLVDPVRDPVQDHVILAVESDLNRLRLRCALYIHVIILNVGLKIQREHKHTPSEKTPL